MSKFVALVLSLAVAGTFSPAIANPLPKLTGQKLLPKAKVSPARARAIALRAVHGTIVSQELEYEAGGSGLRYTIDLKTIAGKREVGVDAKTGAVLENIPEKG